MTTAIINIILILASLGGSYIVHLSPVVTKEGTIIYYNCQSIEGNISCHEYVYELTDLDEEPSLLLDKHYDVSIDELVALLTMVGDSSYVVALQSVEVSNYYYHYSE